MTRYIVPGARTTFAKAGKREQMDSAEMPDTDAAKPSQSRVNKSEVIAEDKQTAGEEKSPFSEQRHWVNEACGDDLWET